MHRGSRPNRESIPVRISGIMLHLPAAFRNIEASPRIRAPPYAPWVPRGPARDKPPPRKRIITGPHKTPVIEGPRPQPTIPEAPPSRGPLEKGDKPGRGGVIIEPDGKERKLRPRP